jgi:hypothetical protein
MQQPEWTRRIVRTVWVIYLGGFVVLCYLALLMALAIPFFAALGLLVASVLGAVLQHGQARRNAMVLVLVSIVNGVLGVLLIGGPHATWYFLGGIWRQPPGLPDVLRVPVWVVCMCVSLGIPVLALRSTWRDTKSEGPSGCK